MLAIEWANAHRQNNFDCIPTGKIDFNKQDELPRDKLVNLINHFGSWTFDRAHVSVDLFGNTYEYLIRNFATGSYIERRVLRRAVLCSRG